MVPDNSYVYLHTNKGILIGSYMQKLHISLPIAKEIVRARMAFTQGQQWPVMIIGHEIVSISKPAREYLASPEATQGLIATAIVVQSEFHRIIGNFFISVNKTSMPVKIFSNVQKAEKWLAQFIR
ncbi:hypothetical protein [Ferruginibacter sp. SUN106]|uniref:DUF7793 family protein n=1 Tax=Ferruginibacter sp. SUN106 TaxID=2978348 RepID=UPI003D36F4C6